MTKKIIIMLITLIFFALNFGGLYVITPFIESKTSNTSNIGIDLIISIFIIFSISRLFDFAPSQSVAIYVFFDKSKWLNNLVYLPLATTKTPLANGSNIPLYPILFNWNLYLIDCKNLFELTKIGFFATKSLS